MLPQHSQAQRGQARIQRESKKWLFRFQRDIEIDDAVLVDVLSKAQMTSSTQNMPPRWGNSRFTHSAHFTVFIPSNPTRAFPPSEKRG